MLKNDPKSLSALIANKKGALGDLAGQARLREDLSDYLRKQLPASLADGFLHCNVRDGNTLIVLAASPEWASRLRFETQLFRDLCAQQGLQLEGVQVKVGTG
jgi:hypothetical protein